MKSALMLTVPDGTLEALARAVADLVTRELAAKAPAQSPWLDVAGAAGYLTGMTPDAVRGLVKRRQIPFHKTPNGRLMFDRHELDAWVRGEAV
jgi:hypothetical protein